MGNEMDDSLPSRQALAAMNLLPWEHTSRSNMKDLLPAQGGDYQENMDLGVLRFRPSVFAIPLDFRGFQPSTLRPLDPELEDPRKTLRP